MEWDIVRMFMMQPVAIHPGNGIDIEPEGVIHDRDRFYKPFFVVERSMRDSHMKDIRQIHPAEKPKRDEIDSADEKSSPRSQMRRSEEHASQNVENNNQIADEIVCFHDGSCIIAGTYDQGQT